MPTTKSKTVKSTYSRYSCDAAALLGAQIRVSRKERKYTAQELADRAGISRGLLQRIEKGDPKCGIGSVFEVAAIIGIKLFDADKDNITMSLRQAENLLTLLPKSIRKVTRTVDDDF
jgi:transcriptional regulator with XRE-family HTH domain